MVFASGFTTDKNEPKYEELERTCILETLAQIFEERNIKFDSTHSIIISKVESYDPFDEFSFTLDRYKFWVAIDEDPRE